MPSAGSCENYFRRSWLFFKAVNRGSATFGGPECKIKITFLLNFIIWRLFSESSHRLNWTVQGQVGPAGHKLMIMSSHRLLRLGFSSMHTWIFDWVTKVVCGQTQNHIFLTLAQISKCPLVSDYIHYITFCELRVFTQSHCDLHVNYQLQVG